MATALTRRDEAFDRDEIVAWVRRRVESALLDVVDEFATLTLVLDHDGYVAAARLLKEEPRLAFTMMDCVFGVDAGDDGFDVIAILYSVETGRRVLLRTRAEGGRAAPTAPTLTHLFAGANWHERETWDMFGIEFDGHPGLSPRLLCAENFEGWPLRKDFHLATREAKPWPGVKEPAELDEEGNLIERIPGPGEAPGPTALDEAMAAQAQAANPQEPAEEPEEAELPEEHAPEELVEESPSDAADRPADATYAAEEQRASAARARAERADELAADGPVTGDGDGEPVAEGDPDAFARAEEDEEQ